VAVELLNAANVNGVKVPARMLEKQDGYVVAATVTNHFIQELQ
jgi:hypothetical protein